MIQIDKKVKSAITKELENYKIGKSTAKMFFSSMKEINLWLQSKES